ncbi:glutathione S-transferase [Burkholderia sp. FERM BP-3421]|jgi:glutathione S-transferase|uniref:glutathione S-transferase family protein n=1 Tax=Burkholderia sp. FERM BP-3421 TaxID=1494466 RepID=UPI002360BCEB|nr:glutathione S-transferase [Burkholderia sp. FERM BP-3421]WDD95535.1 glutathione S-transferase [Burkholderia sp. FERM BP-3421]
MKLYYWPKTRAFRALWMLEEIGAAYELVPVNIRAHEQDGDAFHRVNPMAKLPALEDGGMPFGESGAVLLYLADRYPAAGLGVPLDDPLRGRFLQWMNFTPACLEPAMAEKFTGAAGNPAAFGWGSLERVQQALDATLDGQPWLLGERFSAADILLVNTLEIALSAGLLPREGRYGAYVDRAHARDGYRRACAVEARELARLMPG